MSTIFTDEQQILRESVRKFAQTEVAARAVEIDQTDEFPDDLYQRCIELDLLGLPVPVEYGGMGADLKTEAIVMEEIGKVCPALALTLDVHYFAETQILGLGTEEQKRKFLPDMVSGKKLGGVSNTDASGTANMSEWAVGCVREGDFYRVNTSKVFQTSCSKSGIIILTVMAEGGTKKLIVDREESPGVNAGELENKMGLRGSDTGTLNYDDVLVPVANELFDRPMKYSDAPMIDVSAICMGIAEASVDITRKYLQKRSHGGKPIIGINQIPIELAKMLTTIEVMRGFLATAEEDFDNDVPLLTRGYMAKSWCSEEAAMIAHTCIEMCGAVGYSEDTGLTRRLRDAEGFRIAEGATNTMRAITALFNGIMASL
ncbi:MAG: acyl-CoA dehydrogenase family protein [Bacteroidales bacterium]|nr:acyl-CoA dehydrogenase family protein [Bacteroidales bacterium]